MTGVTDFNPAAFLAAFADALKTGNIEHIATFWEVPALVISDTQTMSVTSEEMVRTFFSQAVKDYNNSGIVSLQATIDSHEELTPSLHRLAVTWSNRDVKDAEVGKERVQYIVRAFGHSSGKIEVAIMLD